MTEGAELIMEAKVLTVSDGVIAGTRDDRSGRALGTLLGEAGWVVVDRQVVEDGEGVVASTLRALCAGFTGLVVTTGGTGFAPRDQTPEGTRAVIERDAPGLAEAMRAANPGPGRLSRGVAGVVGRCVVLNTPGSPGGAVECLGAVLDALPHAVLLLADVPTEHPQSVR